MKHHSVLALTRGATIAALYVLFSMISGLIGLAFGPVQLRLSETLAVLPCLLPEAVPALFAGCILSNLLSPYGALDLIIGSLATLLAAILTRRIRKPALVPLPAIVCNAVLVGLVIALQSAGSGRTFAALWLYYGASVALGEAVTAYLLGLPLLKWLNNFFD